MTPVHTISGQQALLRLAANPNDGEALIAIYEHQEWAIKKTVFRWLGKNAIGNKAVLNVLLDIARTADLYDPGAMDAERWVVLQAEREATKWRCVLEALQAGQANNREDVKANAVLTSLKERREITNA